MLHDPHTTLTFLVALLLLVVFLAALARRIGLPYPLVLLVGGLGLALVPGLPHFTLRPELVLLIVLPPLLYGDAWDTSWRDFRANLRPILLLSVGLVLATTLAVGVVAHAVLPGLPWAAAFALGGIVSPTDAVASVAIAERLRLPHRLVVVLEGESLVNDASGLVAFRFALAALATGQFVLGKALLSFLWVAAGGLVTGLVAGWLIVHASRLLRDATLGVVFSLVSPFLAYLPAEAAGTSGVLAVVAAGLVVGRASPRLLRTAQRLTGRAVWDSAIFVVNGTIFLLLGLQLRTVLGGLHDGGLRGALLAGAAVTAAVVVVRIAWVFPATALPRLLSRRLRERDPMPSWRSTLVVAWTGLRGAVALAIAFSLPLEISPGHPFPMRAELLFVTFVVVVGTLLVQGLSLPVLIRAVGLEDDGTVERETRRARLEAARAGADRAEALLDSGLVARHRVQRVHDSLRERSQSLASREPLENGHSDGWRRLMRDVLGAQRGAVLRLRDEGSIGDDARRLVERELDLEEERLDPTEDV